MRSINPFTLQYRDYSIRITNIRQTSKSKALGNLTYFFKMIIKNENKNINYKTEIQELDADDLEEFKNKLRTLFLISIG